VSDDVVGREDPTTATWRMPWWVLGLLGLTGLVAVVYVRVFSPDAPARSLWITLAVFVLPIAATAALVSRPGATKPQRFAGGVVITLLLTCAAVFLVIVWDSRVMETSEVGSPTEAVRSTTGKRLPPSIERNRMVELYGRPT